MKNKYKKSPITEAVCEFRFDASSPWDMAIPGLIYEKVKNQFPKREQLKRIDVKVLAVIDSFSREVTAVDQIRFLHEDGNTFLAVSPHVLSAHILKPYSSWTNFLPLIKLGFDAYCQISAPKGFNRIGLRYINKIEFAENETGSDNKVGLENYFEFRPYLGQGLNQDYHSFSLNTEQKFEDMRDNLKILLRKEKTKMPNQISIILDFDYSLLQPDQVSSDDVFDWVEEAHLRIYDTFEACIMEKLRKKFKPENS